MNVKATTLRAIAWLAQRHLLGVSIVGVSIVLAALIIVTGPRSTPKPLKEKAWPVSIVKADPGAIAPTLSVYGKVESRHMAILKTSVSAPVESVLTPEGTWVNKGDVMIRLDKTELALSVRSADSDYKRRLAVLASARNDFASAKKMMSHYKALKEIAQAKLKRNQALFRKKMISDAILDEARQTADQSAITFEEHVSRVANFPSIIDQDEAMVAEGKAILDKAKLDLDQAEIRAPFSGRVIATMVA
ncbi:MAG TPA: hypothetical protein VJ998_07095, partial [Pseudomonadales bacterium]|nr:hypothetical protein [Pseudomonadales bacterium]